MVKCLYNEDRDTLVAGNITLHLKISPILIVMKQVQPKALVSVIYVHLSQTRYTMYYNRVVDLTSVT